MSIEISAPCPNCDGSGIDYSRALDSVPDPRTGELIQRGPEPCGVCRGTGDIPAHTFAPSGPNHLLCDTCLCYEASPWHEESQHNGA